VKSIFKNISVFLLFVSLAMQLTSESGYLIPKKYLMAADWEDNADDSPDEKDDTESKKEKFETEFYFFTKSTQNLYYLDVAETNKVFDNQELIYKSIPKAQNTPPPEYTA
jgi:hypothetical protein